MQPRFHEAAPPVVVDQRQQMRDIPAFASLTAKGSARYFVSDRITTSRGSRDSVDTCQRAPFEHAANCFAASRIARGD